MGQEAAHKSGIAQWAKGSEKNGERDIQRVVEKQKTKLDIPITQLNIQATQVSWINPRHWFQYIIQHDLLYMLSGLDFDQKHLVGSVWGQFWRKYETLCPEFGLFYMDGINYEQTFAFYIHGDEGRTLKRSALMVTSLQSILGSGFQKKKIEEKSWRASAPRELRRAHVFDKAGGQCDAQK